MAYHEIRLEHAWPRQLAAAAGSATRDDLGSTIIQLLDLVWPVIREQGLRTGHNVVVYLDGLHSIVAGVEIAGELQSQGPVHRSATPTGPVVTTAYFGDYAQMAPAYAALERWCADHHRCLAGPSWEVYGDWEDDPQRRRTDIYLLLNLE